MAMKLMKRMISFILAVVLVVGGCLLIPTGAEAADDRYVEEIQNIRYVRYKEYSSENYPPLGIEPGRPGGAEEYSGVNDNYGYLFGGWYVKRNGLYAPLQAKGDARTGEEIYAKYVPANILSVRCQNEAGDVIERDVTDVQFISAVDSLNYRTIGFEFYRIKEDGNGYYKVGKIGVDGNQETKWTYDYLYIYGEDVNEAQLYSPSEVFGGGAKYFTTWRIEDIGKTNYSAIIGVKPYWVTMDGVKVYGLSRYMHVEDGYLNYINVPVNLHNAKNVAAGMLKFKFDSTKYEFVDVSKGTLTTTPVECGRMFEEFTYINGSDGTIECVANVAGYSEKISNDLYMNVRLKPTTTAKGIYVDEFDVFDESFSNWNEDEFDSSEYDVWKIRTGLITDGE